MESIKNEDWFIVRTRSFGVEINPHHEWFGVLKEILGEMMDRIETLEAIIEREIYNA